MGKLFPTLGLTVFICKVGLMLVLALEGVKMNEVMQEGLSEGTGFVISTLQLFLGL